jgi:uncharacterized protein (DUF1015 family)
MDLYAPEVYARGKENFQRLISEGSLRQDSLPAFYLYRQQMGRHSQVGLVAVASCEEYLAGTIKKHELTRPDKEDDRVRHIEALDAQTGPAFLVYPARPAIDELVARTTGTAPEIDFTATDGVRHSSWTINDVASLRLIEAEFAATPALYIADGHHRSAAAGRVFQKRQGAGQSGFFLSVIFPHNQVQILPYNRVVKDLNGLPAETVLARLEHVFEIRPTNSPTPSRKHELGFYLAGRWYALQIRKPLPNGDDPVEQLDVSLLQNRVLAPLFGIDDPRTSRRLSFVGGIRGAAELEKLVDSGEYACAFTLFPTGVGDLMTIADAGGIMPPKSTWFEPKLRDAMFCHLL